MRFNLRFQQGKILHVDGHDIEATIKAIKWAREEGIFTVIDIDKVEEKTPQLIRDVDFLITSSTFGPKLTGIQNREKALMALKKYNKGFLCTTLGRREPWRWWGIELSIQWGLKWRLRIQQGQEIFFMRFYLWAYQKLRSARNPPIRQCGGSPEVYSNGREVGPHAGRGGFFPPCFR